MTTKTPDQPVQGHTELPWRAEGPDMFGDYNIIPFGEELAVAAVVSNMRPGAEVRESATLLTRAANSHYDLIGAMEAAIAPPTKGEATVSISGVAFTAMVAALAKAGMS